MSKLLIDYNYWIQSVVAPPVRWCCTLEEVVLGVLIRVVCLSDNVERRPTGQHLKHQHTQCPPVHAESYIFMNHAYSSAHQAPTSPCWILHIHESCIFISTPSAHQSMLNSTYSWMTHFHQHTQRLPVHTECTYSWIMHIHQHTQRPPVTGSYTQAWIFITTKTVHIYHGKHVNGITPTANQSKLKPTDRQTVRF